MLDVNGARGAAYRSNSAPNLQLLHLHKQLHHPHINDWMDVVMAAEGTPVTLPCSDEPSSLAERVTWMVMRSEEKQWTSLLSVNTSRGLVDQTVSRARGRTFEIFEDVSLQFTATATDGGRYSCLLQQTGRKLKERIILLALFKLTLTPAPSVPVNSTVRLIAQVSPSYAIAGGMWLSPAGVPLLTAYSAGTLLTKLPRVSQADNGIYTCSIHAYGQSSKPEHNHTLTLNVNVREVESFPNVVYVPTVSKASLSSSEVTLPCPEVKGDFVRLYWWAPDKVMEPKMVFQFDRWRNHTEKRKSVLQLLGSSSSSSADGGVFSFLLKAALGDAGRYQCEVFLDDSVQCQSTTLTILHGSRGVQSLPGIIGRKAGIHPGGGRQSFTGQHRHTHIHTYGHFRVANPPATCVFGLWEETGAPRGNPRRHGENTPTPHRQSPGAGIEPTTSRFLELCDCDTTCCATVPPAVLLILF
ncbi:g6f-like isoform X3 [Hoplias malabaricus]|uniref:g6f-like isoform X3 n=1 Tax=Hoplias malabaricus TaxID=27720 RepID=UPI0034619029